MKITDLEKRIGTFRLQIDHLDIEPGRIHGIIGPNGCGKTVLLKTIAGIYKPDQGRIDYEGVTSREITMMSQRPYLMDTSSHALCKTHQDTERIHTDRRWPFHTRIR